MRAAHPEDSPPRFRVNLCREPFSAPSAPPRDTTGGTDERPRTPKHPEAVRASRIPPDRIPPYRISPYRISPYRPSQ